MVEAAPTLGIIAAILLIVAFAAVVKLRGPMLQRLDGSREPKAGHQEIASQLLVLAVGFSAISAVMAVVGWIVT